jgi:hypothetical protein
MNQYAARLMIRRRAAAAGVTAPIGNDTFRATGIIAYLANVGALEHRQCPRTTKPYDRMDLRPLGRSCRLFSCNFTVQLEVEWIRL